MVDMLERGHTYIFYCNYYNEGGVLEDPSAGNATAKLYLRDTLLDTLSPTKIAAGRWKAQYTLGASLTLEEHYIQWSWNDVAGLAGRYKFRVIHTGINQ